MGALMKQNKMTGSVDRFAKQAALAIAHHPTDNHERLRKIMGGVALNTWGRRSDYSEQDFEFRLRRYLDTAWWDELCAKYQCQKN